MKYFSYIAMFLGLSLITNCASITSGDTQTVAISTPLCVKATCEIVNGQGQYYVAMTPGMVQINQSASDLVITCSKNDISKVISVASGTAGSTFGNILLGGGIGALYDMQTGAAYKYDSNIVHPLDCSKETPIDQKCEKLGLEKGTDKFQECLSFLE
ncbi:hypothetical protein OAC06_07260 [Alphaproteobacteria bacterium]|nr:hypothetical protein [Alphaproteobacteria bacterium]